MAAGKPSRHTQLQPEDRQSVSESANRQDIFHSDDPAVTGGRMAAMVENTHVSGDLKVEKLVYVYEMLVELKQLAASIGEPMVCYLIDMAAIETSTAMEATRFNNEFKDSGE